MAIIYIAFSIISPPDTQHRFFIFIILWPSVVAENRKKRIGRDGRLINCTVSTYTKQMNHELCSRKNRLLKTTIDPNRLTDCCSRLTYPKSIDAYNDCKLHHCINVSSNDNGQPLSTFARHSTVPPIKNKRREHNKK